MNVFDAAKQRRNKRYAASRIEDADFIHEHANQALVSRLSDVKRNFETSVLLSSGLCAPKLDAVKTLGKVTHANDIGTGQINIDYEALPFVQQSIDCIIGAMVQHHINDLPGHLIQIRKALRPDGLFIGTILGGESLYELRQSFAFVEAELYGEAVPHVHPMADKPQMGDLLMRAGFALPVVDSDVITVSYKDIFKLMHDVKDMGEGYALTQKPRRYNRDFFLAVDDYYRAHFFDPDDTKNEGRIIASFEIIYLLGWSPDASQQKPLRPGSAKARLADALDTVETNVKM